MSVWETYTVSARRAPRIEATSTRLSGPPVFAGAKEPRQQAGSSAQVVAVGQMLQQVAGAGPTLRKEQSACRGLERASLLALVLVLVLVLFAGSEI